MHEKPETPEKRSYGLMLLVSVLVGCLEVALTVVVIFLYVETQPPPDTPVDHTALAGSLLSLGLIVAVIAVLLTLVFVLPSVALAHLLGRLTGGREAWWWVPLTTAALVAAPIWAFASYNDVETRPVLAFWAIATASLSAGGLIARLRHPELLRRVALGGTALVVGTGLLGALGLTAGLLPAYEPPKIGPATMPGTWGDHTAGKLVFTSDGRVTAFGVAEHRPGDDPHVLAPQCSGSGTWSYEPGRGVRTQKVRIQVPGCSWPAWSVGGTDREPRIRQDIGGPDSGYLYELRKVTGGS
ncbi:MULTISPECIES: hypothetical protein [unclassified Streptomyces]|uniref:hypothetical protein n=1 Tax=unclassified Streptomyces TaxID=2593676 RepID=UPI002886A213|nr:hypothetical protein [Streptomyces sp. DSM 41633]